MYRPGTLILLIIMLAAVTACGKTGDLYLPDETQTADRAVDTEPVEQD